LKLAIRVAGDLTVKGFQLKQRTLNDYEIVYFPEGTGTVYTVGGVEYVLDRPCVILTRPGELHSYTFDPDRPTQHLFVHFDVPANSIHSEALPSVLREGGAALLYLEQEIMLPNLIRHLLELARTRPSRWTWRAERLLLTALEELDGAIAARSEQNGKQAPPSQITKVLGYIEDNLHRRITIEDLARLSGWTHEHFSRSFRKWMNLSPQTFILERRIAKACHLLQNPEYSIKQIAYMLGFETPTYFYRIFKQLQGMTASEYRNKYADPRFSYLYPKVREGSWNQVNGKFPFPSSREIK
jgi:AraC-like DNA-binding protein